MRLQDLNQFFAKSPEAQQALVNAMGEAGVFLEKATKRLEDNGVKSNDNLHILNYGMAVGMFSALAEIGLGVDVDGDEKKEVIEKAKNEVKKAESVCPLTK